MELKDKLNLLWKYLFLAVFTYAVINITCCNKRTSCYGNKFGQVSSCCSLNKQIESGEKRGALFMGLGDLVIPGALVVSSKAALGWGVGLASMLGSVAGFFVLMTFVLSGRPQAGLPLLNGGAIRGYLIGVFLFNSGNLGL